MKQIDRIMSSTRNKDLLIACIIGIICVIVAFLHYHMWNGTVEFWTGYANNDRVNMLWYLEKWEQGNFVIHKPDLVNDYAYENVFFLVLCGFFSFVTNNASFVFIIYILFSFFLTAFCMYVFLRKYDIKTEICVMGAFVFSFLPFHDILIYYDPFMITYYSIPIAGFFMYDIYSMEEQSRTGFWFKAFLSVMIAISGIYFSVFSVAVILTIGFMTELQNKNHRKFRESIVFSAIIISISSMLIPLCYEVLDRGSFVSRFRATGYHHFYTYQCQMRLSSLLLPIIGHRGYSVLPLSDITLLFITPFDVPFHIPLGGIAAVGFILMLIIGFTDFRKKIINRTIVSMSSIFMILFFIFGTGGLSIFFAYFMTSIFYKCSYVSIVVATFSLLTVCLLLDRVSFLYKHKIICRIICVLLAIIALFDQIAVVNTGFRLVI